MSSLPKGWDKANLAELTELTIGGDWGNSPDEISEGYSKVKVIRGTEYKNWERKRAKDAAIRQIKQSSLEKRGLKKGDIVVEISGGGPDQPVGRTLIVDDRTLETDIPLVPANFCRLLRPSSVVDAFFLNYNLKFQYSLGSFNQYQTQTTNLRNLNYNDFLQNVQIPIPPPNEQKRIVAKLDKLLAGVEESKTRLEKIPVILKRFRQAVLNAAVTGELTKEWRKKNVTTNVSKNLIKHQVILQSKLGNKNKKSSGLVKINLPNLPPHWAWVQIDEIKTASKNAIKAGPFGSALKKEYYVPEGYKVYGQEQVIRNDPEYGNYFINEEKFLSLKSCEVKAGDILVSLVGTIGKILILPDTIRKGIINPRLVKLSLERDLIYQNYFKFYMESMAAKYFFAHSSHGGTMDILNLEIIRNMPIPLPPLSEQKEIVKQINVLLAEANKLESRFDKSCYFIDKLTQSILSKAFRGELVPQDPNDESAENLPENLMVII